VKAQLMKTVLLKNRPRLLIALIIAAALARTASATTITDWTFESDTGTYTWTASNPPTPLNSPVPESGAGTATPLGMTNNYTYNNNEGSGSITWCDTITPGGPGGNGSNIGWRIRGPSNAGGGGPGIANGWNSAALQYTQGAEFAVDTSGYSSVQVAFDWFTTSQGPADLQPRYSLNGGTTWTNMGPVLNVANLDVNSAFDTFSLDFSGIPGAGNNPNFAVELVSAYHAGFGTYASATSVAAGSPAALNNSSGNWRFDNIVFTGTAVPEPASIVLAVIGLAAFGFCACRRTPHAEERHTILTNR
jgi:PEP-CTERM motif